jgi:hypothetical protein
MDIFAVSRTKALLEFKNVTTQTRPSVGKLLITNKKVFTWLVESNRFVGNTAKNEVKDYINF